MKLPRRRRKLNPKKILICVLAIILSPVAANYVVQVMPSLTAAAEQAAFLSAGLTMLEGGKLAVENELSTSLSNSVGANMLLPVEPPFIDTDNGQPPANAPNEFSQPSDSDIPSVDVVGSYDQQIKGDEDGNILYYSFKKATTSNIINLDGAGQVKNCTSVSNEALIKEAKLLPEFIITPNSEPQVLIMHTHTTESFEPYKRLYYDEDYPSRTRDLSRSIAEVGRVMAQQIEAAGIGVIHDTMVHDYPSYSGSYASSAARVKEILAEYPSIKVVLDVHRDAIIYQNGDRVAPIAEVDGREAAQVMIISGCDDGTMNMPNYMKNFRLCSLLEQQIEEDSPGLTRAAMFDYRKYNQDLTTGSLLVEVGSHANSLDQVVYSGKLIGQSIARALLTLDGNT